MKSYTFELKDVGCHFQVPKKDAPPKASGALIRVGKSEVPVTLRWIQPLKDETIVGLWYFPPKGMGKALIENRGSKATITYPVELTPEQLGIKPKVVKVTVKAETEKPKTAAKVAPDAPKAKLNAREQKVLKTLGKKPVHVDAIIVKTKLKPEEVLATLLVLEVRRMAKQLPGKNYIAA